MIKTLPRGVRSNNPGNIERNADRWIGMSADQSADPRFVVFDSPDYGLRALMRLLINYQERHGLRTIREIINRWAPPVGRDQNDREYTQNTTGYIDHVSRLTGYDPDESLDLLDRDVITSLAMAIVRHENGDPRPHGRPEFWYDEATYARAAVLAGFQAQEHKPVTSSRTAIGTTAAAAGGLLTAMWEQAGPVIQGAVSALGPLAAFFEGDTLRAFVIGLMLAGFAAVAYAQWDERKRGVK
ncbi:MAG TPA: hypothetical protein PKZ27_14995 [Rhodocyclaceae bacterium]|nr:hypothetical protein [Rhodocyclaceae bacterium]